MRSCRFCQSSLQPGGAPFLAESAWYAFFRRMAVSLRARAEEYENRSEALCEDPDEGVG